MCCSDSEEIFVLQILIQIGMHLPSILKWESTDPTTVSSREVGGAQVSVPGLLVSLFVEFLHLKEQKDEM